MKKSLVLFLGILLVWQAIGTPVTIHITFGDKKQVRADVGTLTIDQSVAGAITSAKFSDSANTAYFVDPAATGTSLFAAGNIHANAFVGDGSALTGISGTPAGSVIFYNGTSCPTGWAEYTAARGFTVVGLPSGGTLNGTVGTALTNLLDRTHTHTSAAHTHTVNTQGSFGYLPTTAGAMYSPNYDIIPNGTMSTASTTPGATGTAATSNVMPYLQLLVCQKS